MPEIQTDYLVVGAGASAMAFVDSLIDHADSEVVMIDRRHRPGGHWLDAYPFVRIHQTSANYGVTSRRLGNDRIDESGFYERATASEICDYYYRVLEEQFIPSGRVRFFGMSDYRGEDASGHHFVSLITGIETTVKVRRKLIDATYIESEIPARHSLAFDIDGDVRVIPPNDLVNLAEAGKSYTVIGAGKTAMDTCNWLMDQGVVPDEIRWIRPRDGWIFDRAIMQPLELVGAYMQFLATWIRAAAEAGSGRDLALRLEAEDVLMRIDPAVEPEVFRGAILSKTELESLRNIENVVRLGKVQRIESNRITLEGGEVATKDRIYIDCTAAGLRTPPQRPVFEAGRVTLQVVTFGIVPWSAATLGVVEAHRDDDSDKNRLCPPVPFTGNTSDLLRAAHAGMNGMAGRSAEPDLATWNEACRLNPGRGAADHMDDPRVPAAFASLGSNLAAAMSNLERLVGTGGEEPI